MRFQNPWGLLALLGVPLIVLLYILKQQYREQRVSSTMLWQRALRDLEASVPWQKLRRSLLLLLQLLAMIAFALAVSRPYFPSGVQGGEWVVVLDASASMQATDVAPSRFAAGVARIRDIVQRMMPGDRLSVIRAGDQPAVACSRLGDPDALLRALDALRPGAGGCSLDEAISLVTAMRSEIPDLHALVITDRPPASAPPGAYDLALLGGKGENCAVTRVGCTQETDGVYALATVQNYGSDRTVELSCYADGRLTDVRDAACKAGESTTVYFDALPKEARRVEVRITSGDALPLDDAGYATVSTTQRQKALLITGGNVFLERALTLRDDVDLYKTTAADASALSGYPLYVFDGALPDVLPTDGNLLILNPDRDVWDLTVGAAADGGDVRAALPDDPLLKYVDVSQIALRRHSKALTADGFTTVLRAGQDPLLLYGMRGNQAAVVLLCDIHDSNLPLLKEYPILMQNILLRLLPVLGDQGRGVVCGQSVALGALPFAQSAEMTLPSGGVLPLAPPFPIPDFSKVDAPGFYTFTQTATDFSGKAVQYRQTLCAQIPQTESTIRASEENAQTGQVPSPAAPRTGALEIWPYLLLAALLILLFEWWEYYRAL